ncbi:MAG: peptide ABC transporter substrate-binding protein [Myxococcales bacterium]|nr:peptide ABC transporter substrate-binding protein [Myxococcales bacterium]MCB9530613.1 peptide ABC transporter substrate-binding protein [Myxococcales bacterium]
MSSPLRLNHTLACALLSAWALAACAGERDRTPLDTFVVALESDPETFDPGVMSGSIEGQVAYSMYEGLLSPPAGDGPPVPGVAREWTTSPDGLTWTFTLRDDARWSNGDRVVAEDFREAWLRMLRGDIAADYVSFVRYIRSARAYEAARRAVGGSSWTRPLVRALELGVGVRAPSPNTLIVDLESPTPFFADVVMFYSMFPVHRPTIARLGDAAAFRAENLVTNGPFRMRPDGYRRRVAIELEQNPYYWDRAALGVDRVTHLIIEDGAARVTAFLDGRVDWADDPPNNQLAILAALPQFHSAPQLGTYFYRVNVTDPLLSDRRVRRALSLALNRGELCRCTLDGLYTVATGFTPPLPGYPALDAVRYDPNEARRLLAEAGYPGGESFPPLEILYNTSENHRVIAQFVQDQWQNELGIDVTLVNQEWKVYLDTMDTLQYQVARSGWIGDYVDPNTFLELWRSDDENNRTGWDDPEYDALIAAALREPDTARRLDQLRVAEAHLLDAAPIIPVYFYAQFHLVDDRVRGWEMNVRNTHLSRWVSKTSEASR